VADNEILVKITGQDDGFSSTMDNVAERLDVLPSTMNEAAAAAGSLGDSFSEVGRIAAGVFGGLEISNVLEKVKDSLSEVIFGTGEAAENLEHLSLSLGTTEEELQKLQGVATLTGTNIDRLTFFTQQLNRQFAAMASGGGSKAFAAALADLSLKPPDFSDTYAGLEKLAEALQRIGPTTQRAREDLAELGGRSAQFLLPLLVDFPQLAALIEKFGVQSEEAVAKASEFQRSLNALGNATGQLAKDVGSYFAPLGTFFDKLFINLIESSTALVKTVFTAVVDVLATLTDFVRGAGLVIFEALTGQWSKIAGEVSNTGSRIVDDNKKTLQYIIADWKSATDKITASIAAINIAPPTGGKGGTGGGFQGTGNDKAAIQQFENLRAELALEVAETGKSAAQKLALEQAFVEQVRQIRGLPLKDLLEAFASEEKAWQAYLASVLKDQLDNLANSETITKAQLSLQQANDQAAMASATQAAQLRLAAGTESRLAELADQMSIDTQKVALEQKTENDQFEALRTGLEQRLAALKASGIDETEAISKAQADLEAAELTHQAKLTEIATKGATDRSKLEVQSITEQMKQLSGEIGSLLEPISRGFDQIFSGVLQGTQSASQAFRKMALDMGLALAQSGIKDLLLGGGANTIGAKLFGQTGQGGGIAGMIAAAFGGPAITGSLTQALSTAFRSAQSAISSVFGVAMNAAKSALGSAAGSAASSGASAGASAAGTAAQTGAMTSAITLLGTTLTTAISISTSTLSALLIAAEATLTAIAAGILELTTLETVLVAITASQEVQPLGFSGGGLVPSAAGGMISPGGLSILHPKEMVLPARISEGMQNLINNGGAEANGGQGQGGDTHIHYHGDMSAIDARGMKKILSEHAEHIGTVVQQQMIKKGQAFRQR
jgi:hypothetical protein